MLTKEKKKLQPKYRASYTQPDYWIRHVGGLRKQCYMKWDRLHLLDTCVILPSSLTPRQCNMRWILLKLSDVWTP